MNLLNIYKLALLFIISVFISNCATEELASARLYVKEQRFDEAESFIKAAIEVSPEDPEAYFLLGKHIYARNDQFEEMNKMFNKVIELNPKFKLPSSGKPIQTEIEDERTKHWIRLFNIGSDNYNAAIKSNGEEKINNFNLAIEAFNTAKTIKPDEVLTYKNLVFCHIGLNNKEMIQTTLNEAMEKNPEDPDLLFEAGKVFLDNKEFDTAIQYLEDGLKIQPGSAIGASRLADAYYQTGDIDGAIFAYTKAIRSAPEATDLHFNLGVLYGQMQDYEMMELQFQKVISLDPEDAMGVIGIAEAYEGMERWSDAEVYYLQALENDPENVYLLKAMVRVTMRLGRPEEAKEWLDKSKEFGG